MKKLYFLPVAALLMLGACSSDDPVRPVPNDPVVSVPAVADVVSNIDYPTQDAEYTQEVGASSSCYRFTFSNHQEIVFEIDVTSTLAQPMAMVKKIDGTAENVIIPMTIYAPLSGSTEPTAIAVAGLNLYEDAVAECVKSITIPATVNKSQKSTGSYEIASSSYINTEVKKCKYVESFELETGYPGYCSLNGAIYTSDFETLVAVPRAAKGTFTVADGVKTIADRAFFYCDKLDVITFPASVEEIGEEAVVNTDYLLLINMLSTEAPTATTDSFGHYAYDGVLRIPAGCKEAYTFEKPTITEPVEPAQPDMEASDEVWDAYDEAMAEYTQALREYKEIMTEYEAHSAYVNFKNIEESNF